MFHFKIVIPSYNTVKWLRKTLDSVAKQSYKDFDVCVIDDASTQEQQREIIQEYEKKYGWKTIFRKKNHGVISNVIDAIALLAPSDQDVIVMMDGDDWFYDRHVLSKLNQIYSEEEVSLTYGQFITYPRWEIGFCRPPTPEEAAGREGPWIYSALRTFQYFLWKSLNINDLKDSEGNYYKTAGDLAMMYPLVEMAGNSIKCVHDLLYVYNHDNPLNDHVLDLPRQLESAAEIRKKPRYAPIVCGSCTNPPASFSTRCKLQAHSWINRMITPRTYAVVWNKIKKIFS